MKKVLIEGLCVALAGSLLAFLANAVSPNGLKLSRNYHLTDSPISHPPVGDTNTHTSSPAELLAANLMAVGLRLIDSNQVVRLYNDPRREQELVLFVDAREEDHYQAGHIPGAYEFNYFHPEKYVADVIPACQIAQEIVVYCNGGSCDESKLAALALRDYLTGVSKTNLIIYGGGITEWATNHLPIELGERKSGRLADPSAAVVPPR